MADNQNLEHDQTSTDNTSLPDNTSQENLKKLHESITKKVAVTELSENTKAALNSALGLLQSLKEKILLTQQNTREKSTLVQEKIAQLRATGKVKFNDLEFEQSNKRTDHFIRLLEQMNLEIERDCAFYTPFIQGGWEPEISAFIFESDEFETFIIRRIVSIKKYVKNAQRDITIGYSRYCFGFDRQLQQLETLDRYIKNLK